MVGMRPFDPRLLRHVPALRRDVILLGLLGSASALAIVASALMLAKALTLDTPALAGFVIAAVARSVLSGLSAVVSARMAATVKAKLRIDLLHA